MTNNFTPRDVYRAQRTLQHVLKRSNDPLRQHHETQYKQLITTAFNKNYTDLGLNLILWYDYYNLRQLSIRTYSIEGFHYLLKREREEQKLLEQPRDAA